MNAVADLHQSHALQPVSKEPEARLREIPYNYTSLADREIVIRLLGAAAWDLLDELRSERRTGRSARMLCEVLGDIWVVERNPFLQDDLLDNPKRRKQLIEALHHRLHEVEKRSDPSDARHPKDAVRGEKVAQLLAAAQGAVLRFEKHFADLAAMRRRARRALVRHTREDNIRFDAYARVTHVTDATDWRGELPLPALAPDAGAADPPPLPDCLEVGLPGIPPRGGPRSTRGAGPLPPGAAGWVTGVDYLLGGRMVDRAGTWREVTRLNHNMGKIHDVPVACFDLVWKDGGAHPDAAKVLRSERLNIAGATFRKAGLGKDVTDKFLGGLPGVQKEGCDGLITSARWVMHRMPKYTRTAWL